MEPLQLDSEIADLERRSRDAEEDPRLWKSIWEQIRRIGAGFKETKYPSHAEHQAAWDRFQAVVSDVKQAQQRQRAEGEKNERRIEGELDSLSSTVNSIAFGRQDWKELWARFGRIRELMKTGKFSSKETREELWQRLNDLNNRAREYSEKSKKEWEAKSRKSEEYKDAIIDKANSARPLSEWETSIADLIIAPIKAIVDVATLGLLSVQVDERKGELQACSTNMKAAWDLLEKHKNEMLGRDKHEAFQKLQEVQSVLDSAWAAWKQSNQQLYESKREAHETRKQAALERRAAFEDRVNANIGRLEDRRDRLTDVVRHKENHLDELRDKRDSAWNDDFRDRVEGWIDEEENAIDDIRRKIDEIDSWIEREKDKLR